MKKKNSKFTVKYLEIYRNGSFSFPQINNIYKTSRRNIATVTQAVYQGTTIILKRMNFLNLQIN